MNLDGIDGSKYDFTDFRKRYAFEKTKADMIIERKLAEEKREKEGRERALQLAHDLLYPGKAGRSKRRRSPGK